MMRFSVLDHFMLSGLLYDDCISSASVKHDVDNLSDHDPNFLHLNIDIRLTGLLHSVIVYYSTCVMGQGL